MWVLGKIKDSMENIPLELSRYMGKSEEDIFLSSKASFSHNLHNNILTPDKIPEFCLPPRLCKSSMLKAEKTTVDLRGQNLIPESETSSTTTCATAKDVKTRKGSSRLKGATSCPSLIDSREDRGRWKLGGPSLTTSLTLAPPVVFPLDILQSQERLQHERVLPLQGRGKVRFFTEHTNAFSSLFTVRVRVVSVEGLRDDTDRRTLNCAVSLYLSPGKLQQQESATIRNCRSPVFNEDFFFTELSRDDLLGLKLRLKVVDKPAAGALRRGTLIGVITKPLSQLLLLKD
ncbi:hypothetical protein L3Q82_023274, partial [Scortum barcoo]